MNYPAIGNVSPNHVPGTRWLLSRLYSFFGSSMVVECKHKRFGSLVLYRHCDLLKALSTALGKGVVSQKQNPTICDEAKFDEVVMFLNEKLHAQAKKLTTEYRGVPSKFTNLDLQNLAHSLDPLLVKFLQKLTQPVRPARAEPTNHGRDILSTKEMRQVYALSACALVLHRQHMQHAIPHLINGSNYLSWWFP